MPMVAFNSKFPEIGPKETRTVILLDPEQNREGRIPAGEYSFFEYYCDDTSCDCRRVFLRVFAPHTGHKVWASINYGWEPRAYYQKWSNGLSGVTDEMSGATLDPLHEQSPYAEDLLTLFKEFVLQDQSYIERLKRHYRMFKETLCPKEREVTVVKRKIPKKKLKGR